MSIIGQGNTPKSPQPSLRKDLSLGQRKPGHETKNGEIEILRFMKAQWKQYHLRFGGRKGANVLHSYPGSI